MELPHIGMLLSNKKEKIRRKKKLLLNETAWMNFKCIMLNESSKIEKTTYSVIPISGKGKIMGKEKWVSGFEELVTEGITWGQWTYSVH